MTLTRTEKVSGVLVGGALVIMALLPEKDREAAAESVLAAATGALEGIGKAVTTGASVFSASARVIALAEAIATAEGFYAQGNVLPKRANNPGNITDRGGPGDTGQRIGIASITVFQSVIDGWNALYQKLERIAAGKSLSYSLGMTFLALAEKWTGGDNAAAWAGTVTRKLGVSVHTTLGEYFGG